MVTACFELLQKLPDIVNQCLEFAPNAVPRTASERGNVCLLYRAPVRVHQFNFCTQDAVVSRDPVLSAQS